MNEAYFNYRYQTHQTRLQSQTSDDQRHLPQHDGSQEPVGLIDDLQPDGRHLVLVKQIPLGQVPQRLQRLLAAAAGNSSVRIRQ